MLDVRKAIYKFGISKILIFGLLFVIFVGTFLLMLPISYGGGIHHISFITAFFTMTSATCVTGLTVVNIGTKFSPFGQLVILTGIQIGGLGLMAIASILFLIIGKRLSYESSQTLKEELNQRDKNDIYLFLKKLFIIVFIIEIVGTICLFFGFATRMGYNFKCLYYAFFHSVSAFCNAGFSLYKNNLKGFHNNYIVIYTISFLIIFGGLGFAVLDSIINKIKNKKYKLTKTSSLAIKVSIFLIILGTVLTLFFEFNNPYTLKNLSFFQKLSDSFFQSVTMRTAGFNTLSISHLMPVTLFLYMFLMFVGASPGSTGGGIKTTTFGVIVYSIIATIKNKKNVEIGNRRIPQKTIDKALAILALSLFFILVITILLMFIENKDFIKILFEVISAFGTVGVSMGETIHLSIYSKFIIIFTMILGRIGPILFTLMIGGNSKKQMYEYPEENVMIG